MAQHLEQLRAAPLIRSLVVEVADSRSVASAIRPGDYVAVKPQGDGSIAMYVHQSVVKVALPPPMAAREAAAFGWSVEEKNDVTSYVAVPAGDMIRQGRRRKAVELMQAALDWRAGVSVPGAEPASPSRAARVPGSSVRPAASGSRSSGSRLRAAAAAPPPPAPPPPTCPVHFTVLLGGRCDLCD